MAARIDEIHASSRSACFYLSPSYFAKQFITRHIIYTYTHILYIKEKKEEFVNFFLIYNARLTYLLQLRYDFQNYLSWRIYLFIFHGYVWQNFGFHLLRIWPARETARSTASMTVHVENSILMRISTGIKFAMVVVEKAYSINGRSTLVYTSENRKKIQIFLIK